MLAAITPLPIGWPASWGSKIGHMLDRLAGEFSDTAFVVYDLDCDWPGWPDKTGVMAFEDVPSEPAAAMIALGDRPPIQRRLTPLPEPVRLVALAYLDESIDLHVQACAQAQIANPSRLPRVAKRLQRLQQLRIRLVEAWGRM
jgi:hypothetical protein